MAIRAGAIIYGSDELADKVGFSDPGTLLVREDDGDGVACAAEGEDEGVDVGGGCFAAISFFRRGFLGEGGARVVRCEMRKFGYACGGGFLRRGKVGQGFEGKGKLTRADRHR